MKSDKPLSPDKRARLERWLSQKKDQQGPSAIPRLPAGSSAPLSYGQQRLWFLQQLYPDNPFYHYAEAYRLRGDLHVERLLEGFRRVVRRHDILRTTIHLREDQPVQSVSQEVRVPFTDHDLRRLPEEEREPEAQRLALAEARLPFDLNQGPLLRITLVRLGDDHCLLILTMHHIITDKWSMQLLRNELAAAYRALQSGGGEVQPTALTLQYADFADWQRKQPADPAALEYWRRKLAGELPVLALPVDHPRPLRPTFRGAYHTQEFSAEMTAQLKSLSKKASTTPFVLLLTAFKVLLYRYSGQEDLLVGTPFTNRDQVALEKLIGFFNETLVLRSDLSGNPRFLDLVEKVKSTVLEAFAHKNVPLENLVGALQPERRLSANPLFQVMFLYHEAPNLPAVGEDLTWEQTPFDLEVAKFDLTLYIGEKEDRFTAIFEYATDLFEPATIERMQQHLKVLLAAIVEDPTQRVASLPLLDTRERQQILFDWNETRVDREGFDLIHRLIEQQAKEKPDQTAVVHQSNQITYRELNDRGHALAARLLTLGVGPGDRIGLCIDRSVEMIIGILGILKAGGAYLPLDPEYPPERISFMVEDAGVGIVLTRDGLQQHFAGQALQMVLLDQRTPAQSDNEDVPVPQLNSDHPAYLIYTSGSTGRPKGVMVPHRNLLHSTLARGDYYPRPPASFLLLSSFSFDSSVAGIFWTLCNGGQLVIPPHRIEQDMDGLAALIARHRVTHTLLLPSLYTLLLRLAPVEKLRSLETVIVAGEACPPALCRQHSDLLPQTDLYNEYGPTEATVWCTAYQIRPEDGNGPIPIGKPIANARIYILDPNRRPVPVGVPGELYVGGSGVAPGYLGRPEVTADRFVPDPFFSGSPEAVMYRTGDLGRYRSDGLIEFLGRADQQVKIRGHRIELDEIAATLRQHSEVWDAVVMVQSDEGIPGEEMQGAGDPKILVELLSRLPEEEAVALVRSVAGMTEAEVRYLLKAFDNSEKST